MRIISCCTRLHAPTTRISLFRHNHHHKLTPSSTRCFSHSDCSVSRHQMEQLDLSANTVIDHPRALTDKTTLIRDAGPSKFQVFPSPWSKTHDLLIEGGLTFDAIKDSVANSSIAFRDGVAELFEFLEEKEIPVLIFSAGLADVIEEVLRQKLHRTFKNVKIVSNRMVFDDDGRLVSFKGKLIHVLNKNEHALDMAAPLHDQLGVDNGGEGEENAYVKQRINVLLLGDHMGDLRMSDGLNYESRISIGFLNDNVEKSLESYRKAFDIVYLNDAPMWGALEIASQLFPSEES
ncbi:hypothetical protein F2Q70_00008587 [Brassica cretica]|uniref:5'-nucleotidase n=1 Tax=Brassica cretica TaxID=69181 RepID=A0A8S9LYY8_BRACR|nr:hypothetical protein F2Q70_00008587 [Brassica cretica]